MTAKSARRRRLAIFVGIPAVLALFGGNDAHAVVVYGVTQQDVLLSWDSSTPGEVLAGVAITGLANNETIQGIDFRPLNGVLYGVGSQSRLYTINSVTGGATLVGDGFGPPFMNGANFGFDFNPTVDAIRLTSDADQSLRLSPTTGEVLGTDGSLSYASGADPNVTHSAYTNNFAGATSTTLYGLDTGSDQLVTQNAMTGALAIVGGLGVNVSEDGGFDILTTGAAAPINTAYAALRPTNLSISNFYTINLTTGEATLVGEIGGGVNIRAMTVAGIIPAPGALGLLTMSLLVTVRRRRTV